MYFGGTGVEVIIIKRVIRDELFGDVENLVAFPVRAQAKLVLAYLADGFDRLDPAQLSPFSPTWFSHSLTGLPMPFG